MSQLPFPKTAQLREVGGVFVTDVPCVVWPSRGGNSPAGRVYDHVGQAPLAYAAALQLPNRELLVDGVIYRIVEAVAESFLPHVSLTLRHVAPSGPRG